jgi:hypothetical protein
VRKEAAQERRRGERASPKPRPQAAGPKTGDGPKLKKKFFLNFQLILEFGRNLKNCTRRFRKRFDMGIFPKIF